MSLSVGVIVCAYTLDRRDDIVAAIDSLGGQDPQPDQVVLVVDYNEQLRDWARERWPDLTVVDNRGQKGLSGARNTGIEVLGTEVVAFLDDDAAARPGWVRLLSAAYEDPRVAAIGGSAEPIWPLAQPTILPPELFWIVGCSYRGQPEQTADVRNVMGCSMSFRMSTLREVGGFITGIGRVDTLPLGCEETELCIRIRQHDLGARVVYEPGAIVDHRVGPQRTGWSYLVRRSYSEGISKAVVSRLVGAGDALSTERSYTTSVLPRAVLRELRARRPAGAAAIVVSVACAVAGYLVGRTRSVDVGDPPALRAA